MFRNFSSHTEAKNTVTELSHNKGCLPNSINHFPKGSFGEVADETLPKYFLNVNTEWLFCFVFLTKNLKAFVDL